MNRLNGTVRHVFSDPKVWVSLIVLIGQAAITWWRVGVVEDRVERVENALSIISVQVGDLRVRSERGAAEREALLERLRRLESKL